MLKSAIGKVMWVGRATVFLVGLAVILALLFGVASSAFGANSGNFILGENNTATILTKLTGQVPGGAALQVVNTKTEAGSRGLHVNVAQDKPPIVVNATAGKALNLNADKVDGHDAPLWAVVNSDGSRDRGQGVTGTSNLDTGDYRVTFNQDVSGCVYSATLAGALQGEISTFEKTNDPDPTTPQQVAVATRNSDGALVNRPFHLIVVC